FSILKLLMMAATVKRLRFIWTLWPGSLMLKPWLSTWSTTAAQISLEMTILLLLLLVLLLLVLLLLLALVPVLLVLLSLLTLSFSGCRSLQSSPLFTKQNRGSRHFYASVLIANCSTDLNVLNI